MERPLLTANLVACSYCGEEDRMGIHSYQERLTPASVQHRRWRPIPLTIPGLLKNCCSSSCLQNHSPVSCSATKEGTNMEHTIQQVEIWQLGTVEITIDDQQFIYPYHFRNDFGVELVNSQNIGCPPSEGAPSTPTATPTTLPTQIVPTLTPISGVQYTPLPEPTRIVPLLS